MSYSLFSGVIFSATTPKKTLKTKIFDDAFVNLQGIGRSARLSLPALDFHGLKLPSGITKSKLSLPAVANTIKNKLSKSHPVPEDTIPMKELYWTGNGDSKLKVFGSVDLGAMREESECKSSTLSLQTVSGSKDISRSTESVDSDRASGIPPGETSDSDGNESEM